MTCGIKISHGNSEMKGRIQLASVKWLVVVVGCGSWWHLKLSQETKEKSLH